MSLIADIHNDLEKGAIRLIAEYRGRLFSEAIRLCGDLTTAEDLVSRTFAKAIDNIDSYKEDVNLFGWLKTILTNLHRNDQRRAVNRNTEPVDPRLLEEAAALDWQTDEQILRDSDSEAVRAALSQLDSKYSQVMLMRYYEDMSVKEIAAFLNKPIGTVLRRIQIAHQLLAGKLGVKLGKAKKPLAVLGAVLLGVGAAFGLTEAVRWAVETLCGDVAIAAAPHASQNVKENTNMNMNTRQFVAATALLAAATVGADSSAAALTQDGGASGDAFAVELTVEGYAGEETLENFPVLVRLSEARYAGFSYNDCAGDGHDIRFCLDDGTPLASELYRWNPSGESLFWVNLPQLAKGTTFRMTYGNPDLEGFPVSQTDHSVWTQAKYLVVWHADGSARNEVSGANGEGLSSSGIVSEDAGRLFGSYRFDNAGRYLQFSNLSLGATRAYSMSCWFRQQDATKTGILLSAATLATRSDLDDGFALTRSAAKTLSLYGNKATSIKGTFEPEANVWYHLGACVCPNETSGKFDAEIFVNSVSAGAGVLSSVTPSSSFTVNHDCKINMSGSGAGTASYDEVRYREAASSADWFAAEMATETDADFLSGRVRSLSGFAVTFTVTGGRQLLAGRTLGFSASVLGLDDGVTISDWVWTLTDQNGSETLLTGAAPQFTPTVLGSYDVLLSATNSLGQSSSCAQEKAFCLYPQTNYVTSAENPNACAPYDTWERAATSLDAAMGFAIDGSVVVLDAGKHSYVKTTTISNAVKVVGLGGPSGTIIDVAHATRGGNNVVVINNGGARVESLSITNRAYNSAAIVIAGDGGSVSNVWITDDGATPSSYLYNADAGAGFHCDSTNGLITHCRVSGITYDFGMGGTAVYLEAGRCENSLFTGVTGTDGGAAYVGARGVLRNCTIVGNRSTRSGGGVYVVKGGHVVSCIASGNYADADKGTGRPDWGAADGVDLSLAFENCLFSEGTARPNETCRAGDPLFKDATNLDFHLTKHSPAVNGGAKGGWTADAVDLDGNPRIFNFGMKSGIVDIGCYETPWGTPGFLLLVK